ncbi:conserved threonine dehydratase; ectoine utilization protein EutB (plasmid) [Sinorhizobium fredii NGR234]|uniref:Putative threonine dehydratase n=1 Tax=Sinorhizobium fredii (strain NBRC 101917 / NGR234) TaxID=394 RepID=Y4TJ_SINFN|nr:hydroxyectoine utilization dehydratase EutB [Sinorhizobium fredii]P55664.1 RecName: Full=Putative threonine dehydratase; AltName: Full=Threonine deaminase [Sinorhizobium fredii NGR234]AAB91863.1 conserved threonine dehydratase; ectoine utilization protein EutB [Sinorhizobium fredii NGR234]
MNELSNLSLESIERARERIEEHVFRTPLTTSRSLTELTGTQVSLKLEHYQRTGSFKLRGATNAILQLSPSDRARGVIAASTGNHGRALSYAAKAVGSRATICMSDLVPENKVSEIRKLGATVRIVGSSQDDAQVEVERLVAEEGLSMIPPFDHPHIIAGQRTVGLEIVEAMPDVAMVLLPLSGGGLAAGVAAAVKALRPHARIIGVTMDRGAAMKASIEAGHPVQVKEYRSLADSLGGGIGMANAWTFQMCRALLDDVVLVNEGEIAAGIRHAYEHERQILEGAGAVGIAALLSGKVAARGGSVGVVLSGQNIDMGLHREVINGVVRATEED